MSREVITTGCSRVAMFMQGQGLVVSGYGDGCEVQGGWDQGVLVLGYGGTGRQATQGI